MNEFTMTTPARTEDGSPDRATHSKFFVGMSALMLAIVLAGFGRSFYLRAYLGYADLPNHLVVHGIVLTAWFSIAFAQTCLIATHRVQVHRRLGLAGVVVAAAVVAASVWTVVRRDAPVIDESPRAAFGNLTTLFAFSICIVIAMLMRKRPAVHKRFMLIASISIMGPAIDRLSLLPPLDGFFASLLAGISMPPQIVVALVGTLSLLLAMPIHDLVSRRRLHAGTIWGVVCILLAAPAMSAAVTFADVWIAFVRLVG